MNIVSVWGFHPFERENAVCLELEQLHQLKSGTGGQSSRLPVDGVRIVAGSLREIRDTYQAEGELVLRMDLNLQGGTPACAELEEFGSCHYHTTPSPRPTKPLKQSSTRSSPNICPKTPSTFGVVSIPIPTHVEGAGHTDPLVLTVCRPSDTESWHAAGYWRPSLLLLEPDECPMTPEGFHVRAMSLHVIVLGAILSSQIIQ